VGALGAMEQTKDSHCVVCGGNAGGRTSLLFRLAYDFAASGKTVAYITPKSRIEEQSPCTEFQRTTETDFQMQSSVLKKIKMK
jgi:hypothetical protein